jgi:hypothetical protein
MRRFFFFFFFSSPYIMFILLYLSSIYPVQLPHLRPPPDLPSASTHPSLSTGQIDSLSAFSFFPSTTTQDPARAQALPGTLLCFLLHYVDASRPLCIMITAPAPSLLPSTLPLPLLPRHRQRSHLPSPPAIASAFLSIWPTLS